jgi:predicted hydrocarbon binding protein
MDRKVEFDGWLSPGVALVLLESLRDVDTPPEVLEDEAFRISLPRRLGLSDVIDGQMRRYADMRKRRRQLEAGEFLDLLRLISRRPDARMVFEAAGDRLGSEYASRTSRVAGLARRMAPMALRRRSLLRHLRRIAESLSPGGLVRADRTEPSLSVARCLPAAADDSGTACGMITAAFTACAHGLGESVPVRHPHCESRGDEACLWEVTSAEA